RQLRSIPRLNRWLRKSYRALIVSNIRATCSFFPADSCLYGTTDIISRVTEGGKLLLFRQIEAGHSPITRNSTRRFNSLPSLSSSLLASGRDSPYPVALMRRPSMPLPVRKSFTASARFLERNIL